MRKTRLIGRTSHPATSQTTLGTQFASHHTREYHRMIMRFPSWRLSLVAIALGLLALLPFASYAAPADDQPNIFPLSQVRPGMQGVAYTIYSGDQIEKMDLTVIGVLHGALGPKLDVIIVQLHGAKPEHSGVVAGMSGSPVYFDGKLAGALALKLGVFTKEAIAGVTPIQDMLDIEKAIPSKREQTAAALPPADIYAEGQATPVAAGAQVSLSGELAQRVGGSLLVPIETPLVYSGLYPQTLAAFSNQLSAFGMSAMAGGTAPASPADAKLQPGDMVGMDLIRGDLTLSAGCTVTLVEANRVFACGHPLFGFGPVKLPLSRGHVVMTLNSDMASTKIMDTGGVIGTLTQDRATAVMGEIGAPPAMIPVDVDLTTPTEQRNYHFQVVEDPNLTPLLVALSAFNGITGNTAYSPESTLQFSGTIDMKGHSPVEIRDLFAPTDSPIPTGIELALDVQGTFAKLYLNPYELPDVQKINLKVTSLPERRWATIDSAWTEKSEVEPGETVRVKVLLRPYRGSSFVKEIPITIPMQTAPGRLRLLVSDAETLDRTVRPFSAVQQDQLAGLEELIRLINGERHNDSLYATLLQPTPTLLIEDKELPNVPLSELSVLNERQNIGGPRLLGESATGEWHVDMNQVITGQHYLTITVK